MCALETQKNKRQTLNVFFGFFVCKESRRLRKKLTQTKIGYLTGHHCAQPLHRILSISGSARASAYLYNTEEVNEHVTHMNELCNTYERVMSHI